MANQVTLTFAGDAKALEKAAAAAAAAMSGVDKQVKESSGQFQAAGKEAASFRDRMDRLGSKTFETVSSLSDAKAAVEDLIDSQHKAKQATADLAQAQEDLNQRHSAAEQADSRWCAGGFADRAGSGIDAAIRLERENNAACRGVRCVVDRSAAGGAGHEAGAGGCEPGQP